MVDNDTVPRAIGANYAAWGANSTITLCSVNWDAQYRDIVKFASKAKLNEFLDSSATRNTRISNSRYARVDEPIRLPLPIDQVYKYNYVRVHNPDQRPVNGEEIYYYYFIIGVDFITPGVTSIRVQLDVWQTFGDKAKFGGAFIERGHIGIANSKQMTNKGRDYLSVPEGLDTGAEHRTVAYKIHDVINPVFFNVEIVCSADLTNDPEKEDGSPSLNTSGGNYVQGVPSSANTYFFKNQTDFLAFVNAYKQYPWILSAIQSVTIVPDVISKYRMETVKLGKGTAPAYQIASGGQKGRGTYAAMFNNWRNSSDILNQIPSRWRALKKFFTYPYMSIEMTMFSGTPIVIKPEAWNDDNASVAIKESLVVPGQRAVAYPRRYNSTPGIQEQGFTHDSGTGRPGTQEWDYDGGDYLENATSVGNFPTLAIVGNGASLALAQQYHSLSQQQRSADWSQQKALRGNETSYDQATAANENMQGNAMVGRNAAIASNDVANQQNVMRAILSGGSGLVGGAMAGGVPGAALGAATGAGQAALDIHGRNANLAIGNQANVDTTRNNANTANYMRDSNKSLADFAARGDYEQTVAGINAKIQDTALTPPFTSGAAGGDVFNLVNNNGIRLYLMFKLLPPAEMAAIGDYWLRYGYAIRRYIRNIPADLMCMSNFTYWKMTETYLVSTDLPEVFKAAIRGIFEKGVTVWSDPKKIGTIDIANNVAKTGISY